MWVLFPKNVAGTFYHRVPKGRVPKAAKMVSFAANQATRAESSSKRGCILLTPLLTLPTPLTLITMLTVAYMQNKTYRRSQLDRRNTMA